MTDRDERRREAVRCYEAACAHEPRIAAHHHDVGSLERFVGMDAVEALLRDAVALDPAYARAHAALGNIATRRGERAEATASYETAVRLDAADPDLRLALAQLYDTAGRHADGARLLHEALAQATLYTARAPYATRRVLAIKTPGGYLDNALLDFCIDGNRTNLDAWYVTPEATALPDLPAGVVLFGAISERETNADTIAHAIALLDRAPHPVVNHPRALRNVRRWELAERLAAVPGAGAVPARRVSRHEVVTFGFPLLIRPIDTHRGDGLARVDDARALAAYAADAAEETYVLAPFVDYRSADGYYRKYRVIVVDGVPHPYHLGISEDWLVHYWRVSGLMGAHAWMRAEEERFLREPDHAFPAWDATFAGIAAAIGLDYFGVDCTVLADGTVLVFECDPSAFVHCRDDPNGPFAYKHAYVPRIFAALDDLLERRATRSARSVDAND